MSEVLKKIITMIVKPISGKIILEKAKKIRLQVRPNRTREQKNKHQRKKHHFQRKSCI